MELSSLRQAKSLSRTSRLTMRAASMLAGRSMRGNENRASDSFAVRSRQSSTARVRSRMKPVGFERAGQALESCPERMQAAEREQMGENMIGSAADAVPVGQCRDIARTDPALVDDGREVAAARIGAQRGDASRAGAPGKAAADADAADHSAG